MSNVASTHARPTGRLSYAALAFAVGAVVVWALAGPLSDDLYPLCGALGIVAFGLGREARRNARSAGASGRLELGAMIVGGLPAAAVIAALIGWGLSHVV
jgi:hypothetical protein